MQTVAIERNGADYPSGIQTYLAKDAPSTLTAIGNTALLRSELVCLVSSIRCPGNIILQTYDLARALRDAGTAVIGGFHSPMEQEALRLLLRGTQPIVICQARSISRLRVPVDWRPALDSGRLLIVSPFSAAVSRATVGHARQRNRLIAAIAATLFFTYAEPGSGTEGLACEVVTWQKPCYTLDDAANRALIDIGFTPIVPERWPLP